MSIPLAIRMILSLAYIGAGIYVLVKQPIPDPTWNWVFGLACLAYGIFRGSRAVSLFRQGE